MKLFLEAGSPGELEQVATFGPFAGVVHLAAAAGGAYPGDAAVDALLVAQPGDLLVSIAAPDAAEAEGEARRLAARAGGRIVVGLPANEVGFEVAFRLKDDRLWTAIVGLAAIGPALLAVNAGADVVVVGGEAPDGPAPDGGSLVDDVVALCRERGGRPKVLVTGFCDDRCVAKAARAGAWAAAIPPALAVRWGAGRAAGAARPRQEG
jgi:transaldolase